MTIHKEHKEHFSRRLMNANNRFLQGIIVVILAIALNQGVQWINSSQYKYPTSLDTFANKIASGGIRPVPLPSGLDENTKVITVLLFGRTKAGKSSLAIKLVEETFLRLEII